MIGSRDGRIPAFAVGLLVAYAVIDPARDVRNADTDYEGTGIRHIVSIGAGGIGEHSEKATSGVVFNAAAGPGEMQPDLLRCKRELSMLRTPASYHRAVRSFFVE